MGKALTLHLTDPGSISGIPFGPLNSARAILSAEPGVGPEHSQVCPQKIQKQNYSVFFICVKKLLVFSWNNNYIY